MIDFLRKRLRRLFGGSNTNEDLGSTPTQMAAFYKSAIEHGKERLPCCGGMRRYHATYRSGKMKCPDPPSDFVDLRYNPLAVEEDFCPPWGELHFECGRCGCARGVHAMLDNGKRGYCMDPDCYGCSGGCL